MASETTKSKTARKASESKRRGHQGLGRTETRIAGKFRSQYTQARLYEVVRAAALHVKPLYPKELRQTDFDRARSEIGHADAPSARQIATRIGRSWPDIVSDAVDQKPNQAQIDSTATREEAADWIGADHIHYALRRVANHLGLTTLTRDQYGVGRAELIADDRKRHQFGGLLDENLPTLSQIETAAGNLLQRACTDWEKALILAKLERPTAKKKRAIEPHVAIHHYIQATGGSLPTSEDELDRFRKIAGFAVKRRPKDKTFDEVRKDGVAYAATLGLPTTGELPPPGTKPEFDLSKINASDLPTGIVRRTKADKVAAIAAYLDYCDELNVQPRQHHYRALAPERDWPAASHLGEGMTWPQWIKAADEWRQAQLKKAA